MKFKKSNTLNLYLILVLVALFLVIILLLDSGIGFLQKKLEGKQENFYSSPSSSKNNSNQSSKNNSNNNSIKNDNHSESPTDSNNKKPPSESNKSGDLDNDSFLHEIENKDLDIDDFYPSSKVKKSKTAEEMWKFTQELDLFHQIIPKLKTGYLGIVNFDPRIAGIYHTEDLASKKWDRLERDIPEKMELPVFITYDQDRMLLGIFEDKNRKKSLFKKDCTSPDSEWVYVQSCPVETLLYDMDGRLIGIDKKGNYFKKTHADLESEWEPIVVNFEHIPMRQILFNYASGIMLGVGQDFRIYEKRFDDWLDSNWGQGTPKTLAGSVRYVFYDADGLLCGLSRVGLVKKEDSYYLNDFDMYYPAKEKNISVYKQLYAITGIQNMAQYANNNNSNNVYVDGKKISEYKFKDPRLNKFLDYRMNLKKQCRKLKAMKIIDDNKKEAEKEEIRNQKFSRILNEQKNTIDSLMDTIQQLKDSNF